MFYLRRDVWPNLCSDGRDAIDSENQTREHVLNLSIRQISYGIQGDFTILPLVLDAAEPV